MNAKIVLELVSLGKQCAVGFLMPGVLCMSPDLGEISSEWAGMTVQLTRVHMELHYRSFLLSPSSFQIWILCEQSCFRVSVNGQHQFDYNHRVANLQQINRLEIEGDVTLTVVQT